MRRRALLVAAVGAVLAAAAAELDVVTTHGPVQGLLDDELQIRSFLGIPYGAVDRDNRFREPRSPEPWSEVLETKQFTKVCPQYLDGEFVGEEDCLVLNVFVPAAEEGAEGAGEGAEALPVLVHVHGGGLQHGSAAPHVYGARRLVPRGVALVVPNYRLGVLGFLCLRDHRAPGNAGLKDLELALRWVRDNIRAFGGDPDRITVSGEGAGGGAAGLLALSPATDGLLGRLISESGSALSPRSLDRDPVARGLALATSLAGESKDFDETIDVLLQADVHVLVGATVMRGDVFLPCVDTATNDSVAFLPATPYRLMLLESNRSLAVMIGSADGAGMLEAEAQTAASIAVIEADPMKLLPEDLVFESESSRASAAQRLAAQYFSEGDATEKLEQYMRYYTDANYLGPALRAARLLAARSPLYFYEFGYEGALNYGKRQLRGELAGAARGDVLGYVFEQADRPAAVEADDERLADTLSDMWAGFIGTGVPDEEPGAWPLFSPEEEHFLNISAAVAAARGVRPARLALWDELYAAHYIDCASAAPAPANARALAPLLTLALALAAR